MKAKGKKFVALFLLFSLVALSANLYAKERRGAKLVITKTDGQQIEGELITVKPNSLLLLDTEGKDVSVGIADIKVIRIVKKSKALLGAVIGFIICGVVGLYLDVKAYYEEDGDGIILLPAIFGGGGALVGGLIGASAKDKTIRIDVKSDSQIKEALDKLRKKARIRDYR